MSPAARVGGPSRSSISTHRPSKPVPQPAVLGTSQLYPTSTTLSLSIDKRQTQRVSGLCHSRRWVRWGYYHSSNDSGSYSITVIRSYRQLLMPGAWFTFPHSRTFRSSESNGWTSARPPHGSNSASDTSHQPYDPSPLEHREVLVANLDNFKLTEDYTRQLPLDSAPVPQSAPSLRGRSTLKGFYGEGFLRDLSELSGGLRFRYMDLHLVDGARFLLENCTETLETLRFDSPAGMRGVLEVPGPCSFDQPTDRKPRDLATGFRPVKAQIVSVSRVPYEGHPASCRFRSKVSQGSVIHCHVARIL